jgi:transcriptional regulator with XRE-family HTH domain
MPSSADGSAAALTFGARLRLVRERRQLKGIAVARRALPDGTADEIRDFANYLSKIERENVNIGVDRLQAIAVGLGFPTLSACVAAIEQISSKQSLHSDGSQADNTVALEAQVDAAPLPTVADLERILFGATDLLLTALTELRAAIDRLADRMAPRDQPGPGLRAHASHRGPRTGKGSR